MLPSSPTSRAADGGWPELKGRTALEALARHLTRTYSEELGGGIILPRARVPAAVVRRVVGV
eukprot:13718562-Alexandrium_andersonii.AAC.1